MTARTVITTMSTEKRTREEQLLETMGEKQTITKKSDINTTSPTSNDQVIENIQKDNR